MKRSKFREMLDLPLTIGPSPTVTDRFLDGTNLEDNTLPRPGGHTLLSPLLIKGLVDGSHRVSIGTFVMNNNGHVLMVQENKGKFKGAGIWKLPTRVVNEYWITFYFVIVGVYCWIDE
ncbi:hypothetical protein M9H77_02001 [Catharanthus roseus]|uniref:Uncharacterized protein n=1 Tax=Catharanthus roseus TaxID=4058 RepID=A0ACC0C7J3_CATRO|nr:hypothetical protein M9H77_02001 [Catharanthus roseus]